MNERMYPFADYYTKNEIQQSLLSSFVSPTVEFFFVTYINTTQILYRKRTSKRHNTNTTMSRFSAAQLCVCAVGTLYSFELQCSDRESLSKVIEASNSSSHPIIHTILMVVTKYTNRQTGERAGLQTLNRTSMSTTNERQRLRQQAWLTTAWIVVAAASTRSFSLTPIMAWKARIIYQRNVYTVVHSYTHTYTYKYGYIFATI